MTFSNILGVIKTYYPMGKKTEKNPLAKHKPHFKWDYKYAD